VFTKDGVRGDLEKQVSGGKSPGYVIDVDSLDATFGEALPPLRTDPLESEIVPRSRQKLDASSAKLLGELMHATAAGLGVSKFVYSELPILWVVDEAGELWFAVEEVVKAETGEFVFPRFRNTSIEREAQQRLGHPALIGGGSGRIGGEIIFDVASEEPGWFITNGSGRYGLRDGRTRSHLNSVKSRFEVFGIDLRTQFYAPGGAGV
jgi:hypothetical protein